MTDPDQITAEAASAATTSPESAVVAQSDAAPPAEPEALQEGGGDDLGDAGRKALQRERDAVREAKQESERLKAERDAAAERVAELEAAELRREVAAEKRLTPEQAELLVGDDVEQLSDHADRLLAAFAPSKSDLRRRPVEALRSGATGISVEDVESVGDIADRVARG